MIINLNEIKTSNRHLGTYIVNELVDFQIEKLLEHLENNEYMEMLNLTQEQIKHYQTHQLDYLENYFFIILTDPIENYEHINGLNENLDLTELIDDIGMDQETNDIIDMKTFEGLENNL